MSKKPAPPSLPTVDEWRAEIESLIGSQQLAQGVTAAELAHKTGRSRAHIQKRISKAINDGEWEFAGKKPVVGHTGDRTLVPCYRPVPGKGSSR